MIRRGLVLGSALLLAAPAADAASKVTFRSGGSLVVERIERQGRMVLLHLPGGGSMAVEARRIRAVAPIPETPREDAAPGPETAPEVESVAADAPAAPAEPGAGPASAAATEPAGPPESAPAEAAPLPAPATDLRSLIVEAARRHDVDPELLRCLIEVESGFDPYAVSPKGAMGLAQLMPGTARMLGVENPFDPHEAVDAAARHLKDLLERSGGRFVPALAAYNAGQGAVNRWGGLPPYRETIQYIERILQRYAAPGGREPRP